MAGESAREIARRQREKADRLARVADAWERGAEGEEATGRALDALPSEQWAIFHDVRWPGRQRANIDHLAVGPGGVFVIDSKNWSGEIRVRGDVLRQNGRHRETAVIGAAEAGLAVAQLGLVAGVDSVTPVLCFVQEDPLTGWARDVMVCSTANLVDMLTTRPAVLDAETVARTRRQLEREFRPEATTRVSPRLAPPRPAALRPVQPPLKRPRPAAKKPRSRKARSNIASLVKGLVALSLAWFCLQYPETVTALLARIMPSP